MSESILKIARASERDSRGMLYVDCTECNKGCNGTEENKCSAGYKHKKAHKGGCFIGKLIDGLYIPLVKKLTKKEANYKNRGADQTCRSCSNREFSEKLYAEFCTYLVKVDRESDARVGLNGGCDKWGFDDGQ